MSLQNIQRHHLCHLPYWLIILIGLKWYLTPEFFPDLVRIMNKMIFAYPYLVKEDDLESLQGFERLGFNHGFNHWIL